jgi:PPOX class probable F420-dependent enzyme
LAVTLPGAVRAFLEEPRFAVLATIHADGRPQQTVMWYALRDDHVLMNTAAGRLKDHNIRRDSRVSICIEDAARFVTIRGTVTIDDDPDTAQADIFALARRYHPQADAERFAYFRRERRETLRMSIDSVILNGFD